MNYPPMQTLLAMLLLLPKRRVTKLLTQLGVAKTNQAPMPMDCLMIYLWILPQEAYLRNTGMVCELYPSDHL